MPRFKLGILVRDLRPDKLRESGITVKSKTLTDEQYFSELLRKVVEEANEVAQAKNVDELISEIGDLQAVIKAIADYKKISSKQIENAAQNKRLNLGEFKEKQFIEYVEMDETNPDLNYYLTHSDKYPRTR